MFNASFCKNLVLFASLACSLLPLSGCAPLLLGGAFIGASMTTDRRTVGAQLEDQRIQVRAAMIIHDSPTLASGHIIITSYNRTVLIAGEVPNNAAKQLAYSSVAAIENVRNVINQLTIAPNASWNQMASDSVVTTQVKSALVGAKNIYSSSFVITTENGVVYVMGRVTKVEAKMALDVISSTSGVRKVVDALEIIPEAEFSRMVTAQPIPASSKN
jgi:osmotically-inducible protein OsmY